MVQYSELTWNYNQELDMFPKGSQKKKDTIVVIIDGKAPQTIPTMDTPPEARKLPKCRLFVILTIILIISLVLLAGYSAWLFFSYEIDVVPVDNQQQHIEQSDSFLKKRPTVSPIVENALHISTSFPDMIEKGFVNKEHKGDKPVIEDAVPDSKSSPGIEYEKEGSVNVNEWDRGDFIFLGIDSGSDSSVESVYDSSEPYGNSELSSSTGWADYESSEAEPSSSLTVTTYKEDKYLSSGDDSPIRFNRLQSLFDKFGNGDDTMLEGFLSYDVMSSYWFQRQADWGLGSSDDIGPLDDSDYSVDDWTLSSDSDDGSGDMTYSSTSEDWPIDLFSDVFNGDGMIFEGSDGSEDSEGSGDVLYDNDLNDDDSIPRPVDPPRVSIDQSPPERIEIEVCNWPKKLFEKEALSYGSVKMAQYSNPMYDVISLSTSNVFITQIRSQSGNVLTASIFMRDYSVSIVAVRKMVKTPTSTTSSCYFSFLTPDLQEDAFGDDYGRDDEDKFEDSVSQFEGDGLQELTFEIRNPILLGSDLPIFSHPIAQICAHSTKYWASSFHIKQ